MKIKVMDVIVKAAQLNAIAGKKMPIRMSYAVSKNRLISMKQSGSNCVRLMQTGMLTESR